MIQLGFDRRGVRRIAAGAALAVLMVIGGFARQHLAAQCGPNPIICENQLAGNPASEWDVAGSGDSTIQGFATDISVNKGETVTFKVKSAANFSITIYRLGYYAGLGARRIDTIPTVVAAAQPACLSQSATGLLDCGNWAVTGGWAVPSTAVSGIYIARLKRLDTGGASHVVFVVRDDASTADILFQTSDTSWQAYNQYGGRSAYLGTPDRAYKVSYNRPFATRSQSSGYGTSNYVFYAEYPMLRFLERNGYSVTYFTGIDTDRRGATELPRHKMFLSVGHDEYWSGNQRANVEAARNAGVNLAFLSGNEMFWKTRLESSIDGTATPNRTLVVYKETKGDVVDPAIPRTWTGTWRDPRFSPPADGGRPENAVTGQLFTVNRGTVALKVPYEFSSLRFWRNTSVALLTPGQTATLGQDTIGYEWDEDIDNGFRPAGLMRLSQTTADVPEHLSDFGNTYVPGTATHSLTMYRHASGALVFGAGTVQWVWGLDTHHDIDSDFGPVAPDPDMTQATVNLLADMGAMPSTPQPDITVTTMTTDVTPPTPAVTFPAAGASLTASAPITIAGTASDVDGVVASVEVSTDGGVIWKRATGRANWTFAWAPPVTGPATILVRASDDSGNLGSATPRPVDVTSASCPCGIWTNLDVPALVDSLDGASLELGVRFQSDVNGIVNGVRFYKSAANTGTHTGHLWTASGTLLGSVTFTGESASGWQTAQFAAPIPMQAGVTYVVSYFAPRGHYSNDQFYFAGGPVVRTPLRALANGTGSPNGLFIYTAASAFPNETFESYNYWVDVQFTPETTPPDVTITAPAPGASVNGNAVTVTATATDPVGVAGVQFQVDGVNIGAEDTAAPYSVVWNTTLVSNANHNLTAVARDMVGNSGPSAPVTVSVFNVDVTPPTVAVTAPAGGSSVQGNAVTLTASASDPGGVAGVQFFLDGAAFGPEITAAPYSMSWDTTTGPDRFVSITARARDNAGNQTTSAASNVVVDNPGGPPIGLVAAYGFDEGSGTTTADGAGHGHTGAITGATWTTSGRYGTALSFNGTSNLVTVADDPALDLTTGITIEAWVNPTTIGTWRTVVMKEAGQGLAYALYGTNDVPAPAGMINAGASDISVGGTSAPPVNTWTHVAYTYDGTTMRLYVNGTQVGTRAMTQAAIATGSPLRIGGNNIWGEWFAGRIDEVRIYSRAITPAEIVSDLNTPLSAPDTTSPAVAITAPAAGAALTGTVAVSASASDDTSVAGVQFKLDGTNLGAEDTVAPYTVSWDTRTAANGSHVLTAVARDPAGNVATSTPISTSVSNDTTAPSAAITAPAAGATVSGTVVVSGSASDNVGVAGVQFKLDGANFGAEVTAAPYQVSWNTSLVANGSHAITAVARDAAGNTTTAASVTVTVNNVDGIVPTVSMTAPASGATVAGITTVSATAADNIAVVGVQFKVDGVNLGVEDTTAPYSIAWSSVTAANGTHVLTAVARDGAGNTATSAPVTVTVSNDLTAPAVSITAPAAGATVAASITVTASASDNVAVAGVQFKLDGANLGAEVTAAPYQVAWTTTATANGSHTLTAVARDAAGNQTTAAAVAVTVNNVAVQPSGLVAAFGFDEGAGTTAGDFTGNGHTATITGATWNASGKYGSALSFNGTSNLLTVADAPDLDLTNGLTLEAWINPSSAGSWRSVVMKENNIDLAYAMYGSTDVSSPGGFLNIGGSDQTTGATAPPALNAWTHIAFTYDGATMRFYVNGTQVGSKAQTGNIVATGLPLRIGGNNIWGEYFAGRIDEVRIYNRALTAAEVAGDLSRPVSAAPDTAPPSVGITSPAGGATLAGTATISASASDDVGVAGVQFKLDGVNLGAEDTASPYSASFNTTTAANGSHVLTAVARDAAGNTTTSAAVTVSVFNDSTAPAVSISAPAAGSTVADAVTVSADATDNVAVVGVQFKADGANLGAEVTAAPYQVSWNTLVLANGSHTLTAVARDAAGNITTAAAVSVTVNNVDVTAPAVSVTAPANGATVLGTFAVSATASDNIGVAGVQFKVDGTNAGAEDTASPYSINWDSKTAGNGSHTLTAVARDAAGNTTASSAVIVTVNNDLTPPSATLTSPAAGATLSTSVNVTATASDNVAVAGVQFKVDNVNIGAEDTAAPYQVSWNTATIANGSHVLTAVARDLDGNTAASAGVIVSVSNDTTAPIVSITSPAAAASVADTIVVTAAASDDINLAGVQFKLDGANLGAEVTAAPYQVSWNTALVANGSHTLTAVARDATGNTATATAVAVSVNNVDATAPAVSVTAPVNGATVLGTIAVSATASDNIGVSGVQFKLDGVNLGAEDTASPFTINWDTKTAANGSHSLTAVARDAAGNTTTAAADVTVNNDLTAPTVSVTSPADLDTVSGAVSVTASASDNVGVAGVQFLLDGAALGAEVTVAPYTTAWSTTTATNGNHTLSARARDAAGNLTTSTLVTVTVANVIVAGPPVIDQVKFIDQDTKKLTVAATGVTTASANELLLAFISTDALGATNTTVKSIAGGGLTWELVKRQNAQKGTSEIWRAFAAAPVTNITVTATLSVSVTSSMTVATFSNVDTTGVNGAGAIGAIGGDSKPAGAPVATLTTTRDNSLVWAVGNDYDNAVARTVGAGQTLVHQKLSSVGDTYWMQRLTSPVPASGTLVTVNATAPTADRFNLAICEIRGPQ